MRPKRALDGALAGLIATIPMTFFMLACHRNLPARQRYPLPPSLITRRAFGHSSLTGGAAIPNPAPTLVAHFTFGAASGILYAAAAPALRRHSSVATGLGYGLCVWGASYMGWVPAMKLMPPATHQPAKRNAMMIAAHIVWGGSLGYTFAALSSARGAAQTTQPS
jgi:uncharacterized membrane protein YagU involved in acid resistance